MRVRLTTRENGLFYDFYRSPFFLNLSLLSAEFFRPQCQNEILK
jgi:hypothetical protein